MKTLYILYISMWAPDHHTHHTDLVLICTLGLDVSEIYIKHSSQGVDFKNCEVWDVSSHGLYYGENTKSETSKYCVPSVQKQAFSAICDLLNVLDDRKKVLKGSQSNTSQIWLLLECQKDFHINCLYKAKTSDLPNNLMVIMLIKSTFL